ncbi:MAG: alpha/beta fold hydrolase [Candidatus Omnitrophica bacterium]|nr:alpha/beta fold hydrolase [Candidatus Omnitrophota bacterium]
MLRFFIMLAVVLLFFFACFLFVKPIPTRDLASKANPSLSYQESVKRIHNLRAIDGVDVAPDGHLIFLTHGEKIQNVIVFFHGITNSPRQFEELGKIFYKKGYNVLIPRLPHHGLKDRMTEDHAKLNALELTKLCDESVDIAQGLGKHVTAVGLSMGANMAGWVAQNRSDVDKAVIIAPFLGWKGLPTFLFKPSINLLSVLPNMFRWWNSKEKTALAGPTSAYFRFSTKDSAEIMRLGWLVMKEAQSSAPKTQDIVVVTNELDDVVDEKNIDKVIEAWQKYSGVKIIHFQFDKNLGVLHDIIDPEQPYENTARIYPKLVELIERLR